MSDNPSIDSPSPGAGRFATTHWSVVLAAGQPESTGYRQALEVLCQTYWFPLYAYLRRHGNDAHQAEDYTQAFLAFLLEKHGLRLADPKRGRFRSFLLTSLKNFLSNERARAGAQKRGGGEPRISLDEERAVVNEQKGWRLLALDDALDGLTEIDPELSRLVELRFFGGFSIQETSEVLGVSPATVKRGWTTAKIWLRRELEPQ